jgi:hypothetical protein
LTTQASIAKPSPPTSPPDSTLVLTHAEFGRRPRDNQSGGTHHRTANTHFVLSGRVKGGLYGQDLQLDLWMATATLPSPSISEASMRVLEGLWACSRRKCWAVDLRHLR